VGKNQVAYGFNIHKICCSSCSELETKLSNFNSCFMTTIDLEFQSASNNGQDRVFGALHFLMESETMKEDHKNTSDNIFSSQ
jgi:hypothetical protein